MVTRLLVSQIVWSMEMESSSTMALHSLLEDGDLGEMSRLGKRGVVSWKAGKGGKETSAGSDQ